MEAFLHFASLAFALAGSEPPGEPSLSLLVPTSRNWKKTRICRSYSSLTPNTAVLPNRSNLLLLPGTPPKCRRCSSCWRPRGLLLGERAIFTLPLIEMAVDLQRASGKLVDYKEEVSSGEESDEEYIVPQKRIRVDRNGKGK